MLPVEVGLPELICLQGLNPLASEWDKAVGDLSLIAFYYILRQGEYCVKSTAPDKKQTVQFRVKDVTLFKQDVGDVLRQLPHNTPDGILMCAESATMNLSNQKNGHKNVCINHASNVNKALCPVQVLARRIVSIHKHSSNPSIFFHLTSKREGDTTSTTTTAAHHFQDVLMLLLLTSCLLPFWK